MVHRGGRSPTQPLPLPERYKAVVLLTLVTENAGMKHPLKPSELEEKALSSDDFLYDSGEQV